MSRKYKQIRPSSDLIIEEIINSYFDKQILVVLGQPGIGKTTEFKKAAKLEENAEFSSVGEFLHLKDPSIYKDKVLYLDGLDEQRSKLKGKGIIEALVAHLKLASPDKIRISCRTAEWHGQADLSLLNELKKDPEIFQVELLPLTSDDILSIIKVENPSDFIDTAKANGLGAFLETPGNLELLMSFYSVNGGWPKNRADLMEGACNKLLEEPNREYSISEDDNVNDLELYSSSEYLAAVMLLSGVEGIATSRSSESQAFPSIHKLDDDLANLRVAANRRVFAQREENRFIPFHRKIAEYLSARFLSKAIRKGLSLRRVMALLTGFDGKTAPDLRGVYAWLVTLLAGDAEKILKHDPYGAIIYGDTYSWTPQIKLAAYRELLQLSKQDPWFRESDYSISELGGLADCSIIDPIINYLETSCSNSHFLSVILDALRSGNIKDNSKLNIALLEFVRIPQNPSHYKEKAILALSKSDSDANPKLITLLKEVHCNNIDDEDNTLRGVLIRLLQPSYLTPKNILKYLVKPKRGYVGEYRALLMYKLANKSEHSYLKSLAQEIDAWLGDRNENWKFDLAKSVSRALIKEHFKYCSVEEAYLWLCLNLKEYGQTALYGNEYKELYEMLAAEQEKLFELFVFFVNLKNDRAEICSLYADFNILILDSMDDRFFVLKSFDYVINNSKSHKLTVSIFKIMLIKYFSMENIHEFLSLELLESIAFKSKKLVEVLKKENYCSLSGQEWRQEQVSRVSKYRLKREEYSSILTEYVSTNRDIVASGKDVEVLQKLSMIWFDKFSDLNHDATPIQRLTDEVGFDNVEVVREGWSNVIKHATFNSVSEIAKKHIESRVFQRASLMMVAMDELFFRDKNSLLLLDEEVLKIAIAYVVTSSGNFPKWLEFLNTANSKVIDNTLYDIWKEQLLQVNNKLSGLHKFSKNTPLYESCTNALLKIINSKAKLSASLLQSILDLLILNPNINFNSIVKAALGSRYRRDSGLKVTWLTYGFIKDPECFYDSLIKEVNSYNSSKWLVSSIIRSQKFDIEIENGEKLRYQELVFRLLARFFDNIYEPIGDDNLNSISRDSYDTAWHLRAILRSIGENVSDISTEVLRSLSQDNSLVDWKNEVQFTIANHYRKKREVNFTFPTISQVVKTLSNLEPANVMDLKSLVLDCLHQISSEIRNENSNKYKWFWNTKHGKPTSEHITENESRNILLELLRAKLKYLDVVVEPEVSYVNDKRADIAIYYKNMKLPIEIKRDDHREIWTAAELQLRNLYSRDPASEGNGIYLVFWFDGKAMRTPPKLIGKKPTSALEMKEALDLVIPEASSGLIESLVIDVSVPSLD